MSRDWYGLIHLNRALQGAFNQNAGNKKCDTSQQHTSVIL